MRRIATVLAASLVFASLPSLALAQAPPPCPTYPPIPQPVVVVGPSGVQPGEAMTITGTGWLPGSVVDVYLDVKDKAHYLGSTTVGQNGSFSGQFVIPTGTSPGPHKVVISGVSNCAAAKVLSRTISIGGGGGASGTTLPFTGSSGLGIGLLVLMTLLAVGVLTLLAGRRRGSVHEG